MCGIWGIFSKRPTSYLNQQDMDIARTMSIMSSIRGDHSTGWCVIPTTNDQIENPPGPRTCKNVGGPFNILHTAVGQEFIRWGISYGTSVFGHNRFATRGKITVENAHPFKEGDWILVHNGTIHTGVDHGGEGEPEVDSHALCVKINKVGLKDALASIDGAYAIIAYNIKDKNLYAARNAERPLYHFNSGNMEYIMSEENALLYTLIRHNRSVSVDQKPKPPEAFESERLYVLTEDGFKNVDDLKKISKITSYPVTEQRFVDSRSYEFGRSSKRKPHATISKPPEERVVTFIVDTIEKINLTQWKYNCIGDFLVNGVCADIFFMTNVNMPELVDKTGEAPLNLQYADKTTKAFHIRYRDIKWDDEDPVLPTSTAVGKKTKERIWACNTCAEEITGNDLGIPTFDGGRLCRKCVNEFIKNNGHVHGTVQ